MVAASTGRCFLSHCKCTTLFHRSPFSATLQFFHSLLIDAPTTVKVSSEPIFADYAKKPNDRKGQLKTFYYLCRLND